MAYYIKLNYDEEIELPNDLDLAGRIKLCEDIVAAYPEQFKYVLPRNSKDENIAGNQVSIRLEAMGSYILGAVKNSKDSPVLSEYKEKRIKNNEINISELENYEKYQKN